MDTSTGIDIESEIRSDTSVENSRRKKMSQQMEGTSRKNSGSLILNYIFRISRDESDTYIEKYLQLFIKLKGKQDIIVTNLAKLSPANSSLVCHFCLSDLGEALIKRHIVLFRAQCSSAALIR